MATVRLQLRRGTASQWTSANPILAAGEMGVETDTRKVKIGDGATSWSSLDYVAADTPAIGEIAQDAINDAFVAGTGITKVYNDGANTITVAVDTSVIATKAELAEVSQDSINDALVAGTGLDKTYDDVNNLITIDIDSTVATLTGAQTLTNKTLTSPVINTPTGIVKADVGLDNVDNTSDANKPVSTAQAAANALKAPLVSPTFTGTPAAPTADAGTNTTQIATTAFVSSAVANLVDSAPEALNTLSELATALSNDENFATTVSTSIGTKVSKAGDTMTGALTLNADPVNNLHAATKSYVDTSMNTGQSYVDTSIESHRLDTTNVHGIADTSALVTTSLLSEHSSDTTGVHGIADTSALVTTSLLSEHSSDTTGVHGIADTSALVTTSLLSEHNSDTAGVHGIEDTSVLATNSSVSTAIGIHNALTTNIHGIADTSALVTTTDLSAHTSATTNIHGITNTANLVYTDDARLSDTRTPTDNTVSTAKIVDSAITSAKIADGTIVNADINASAAISQSKIDGLTSDLALKAPLADPTFTGTVVLPSTTSIGSVSATEIGYVDGVTSGIQAQLDTKLASASAASTYAPLASPALTGTPTAPTAAAATNTTQIATTAFVKTAVDNVIASAPGALDTLNELATALGNDANFSTTLTNNLAAKAPLASPTFTGTVTLPDGTVSTAMIADSAITSAKIADGTIVNADINASAAIDQSKIANLTTDLAAKAPLASPTFTGTVTVAASGVAFTDGTQTKAGVPSLTTIGSTISSAFNLSTGGLSLRDQLIPISGTFAVTVPTNATTAYPVGTSISFYQSSGTGANFVAASGVTILNTPGLKLRTTSSSATLTKVATDTWLLAGDLSA